MGKVFKFMVVSFDGCWLVVSNWCGDDVLIVDVV